MNLDEQECRALLARNIKRFRHKKGVSQLDLALEIEISTAFMNDIEMGRKWVSAKTLTKIAKALNVAAYELLKPEEEAAPAAADINARCLDGINAVITQSLEQSVGPVVAALHREVEKLLEITGDRGK